jgi:hypothetical protein
MKPNYLVFRGVNKYVERDIKFIRQVQLRQKIFQPQLGLYIRDGIINYVVVENIKAGLKVFRLGFANYNWGLFWVGLNTCHLFSTAGIFFSQTQL